MAKVTTDIRFDITPVEEWPEDKQADLTISLISYVDRELTTDVERALRFVDIAEKNRLWRFVNKASLAELFERRDLTLEAIEQYRRGVQLLRDKGFSGAITKEQAKAAAITDAEAKKEKQKRGPKPKSEFPDNIRKLKSGGTDTEYTLRRLARDHEPILAKVKSGELSVNQAAIAAGIRKKPTPEDTCLKAFSKVKDRVAVAKEILAMLTQEEVDSLLH